MNFKNDQELKKAKRLLALYNILPSLIWTIISFAPVFFLWFIAIDLQTFTILIVAAFIPAFFNKAFLYKLQLGKTPAIYKKLGVSVVNLFVQNGVIINKLMRKKFPDHQIVKIERSSVSRLISRTYEFEKFHLILFLFFTYSIVYAVIKGYFILALIILLSNIVYNVCPVLLQQYIRIKLILFSNRLNHRNSVP